MLGRVADLTGVYVRISAALRSMLLLNNRMCIILQACICTNTMCIPTPTHPLAHSFSLGVGMRHLHLRAQEQSLILQSQSMLLLSTTSFPPMPSKKQLHLNSWSLFAGASASGLSGSASFPILTSPHGHLGQTSPGSGPPNGSPASWQKHCLRHSHSKKSQWQFSLSPCPLVTVSMFSCRNDSGDDASSSAPSGVTMVRQLFPASV